MADPRSAEQPETVPGEDARTPREIPKKGWWQIARRGMKEASADQVPLLGAGVAFYAFLALFPALAAVVGLYGLFADPQTVAQQVGQFAQSVPGPARSLITDQLQRLSSRASSTGVGIGVIVSLLLAFWSASGGVNNLILAINAAYDEERRRSFIKQRGLALIFTVGAIIFMAVALGLVAVLPAVLQAVLGDSPVLRFILQALRWVLLVVVLFVALSILYRVAPVRRAPKMRWVSVGSMVAVVLWLIASIGFSIYVSTFGNYAKTYGVLAGIVVLLLWLWMTSFAILLGAEINAEAEQQTITDTTKGPDLPLGEREAVKADSIPGEDDQTARDEEASAKTR
jgi:membrane protein